MGNESSSPGHHSEGKLLLTYLSPMGQARQELFRYDEFIFAFDWNILGGRKTGNSKAVVNLFYAVYPLVEAAF